MRTNDLKIQEIRILLHLKHCNIIEMRDFYTSNAQLCIVMEYADGGDLRSEIVKARNEKATIPEEIISAWIIQASLQMSLLRD
jgi:NIMA (never in mitosis gene a)-related kinase